MTKVLLSVVFLAVIAIVTVASFAQVAAGDPDWLAWVLLVVGPLGIAASVIELRDAVRERRGA